MRLLNTSTFKLEDFNGHSRDEVSYAILSHCWGKQEISFECISYSISWTLKAIPESKKLVKCCETARKYGFKYVWIDTCCIDQRSSTELSEAINSMFDWYENAGLYLVYMEDCVKDGLEISDPKSSFARRRWFTRGWTLQELLAPRKVLFFDSKRNEIATKTILRRAISLITGIDIKALQYDYRKVQNDFSIAQKMSWAAKRQTTRIEDIAYLQLEIMKFSDDQSLFAWQMHVPHKTKLGYCMVEWNEGLLAYHPRNSANSGAVKHGGSSVSSYSTTNRGIKKISNYYSSRCRITNSSDIMISP
jgi:hypothetical protein